MKLPLKTRQLQADFFVVLTSFLISNQLPTYIKKQTNEQTNKQTSKLTNDSKTKQNKSDIRIAPQCLCAKAKQQQQQQQQQQQLRGIIAMFHTMSPFRSERDLRSCELTYKLYKIY